MKKQYITKLLLALSLLLISPLTKAGCETEKDQYLWKAAVAWRVVTPDKPVWLAGYASRTAPSQGTLLDLKAKAILLEDASGHRSLLITMDNLGVPKDFSDEVRTEIGKRYNLDFSQIILSSSHTHTGPVISRALQYIYPMEEKDWIAVDNYTEELKEKLYNLTDEVMGKQLQTVRIYTENGIARFQVNRRNNSEKDIKTATMLNGPNDYAVPVMKIESEKGNILAILFGYACHPTTIDINQFSGDWPGFAQIELEKLYPGVVAMFFQGAGADQNPLPRRTVSLAIQYGKQLASTVERVLSEEMKPQKSRLITRYSELDLTLEDPIPIDEMQKLTKEEGNNGRWAKGMIDELKNKGSLMKTYPYPIAYWQVGDQKIFIMGGEVVIAYSIKLKEIFDHDIFVISYANDVMGYIPDEIIHAEGGYEGDRSQRVYGLPAKWDISIEKKIINEVRDIVNNIN